MASGKNSIRKAKKMMKEAPKSTWTWARDSANKKKTTEGKKPVGGQGGRKSRYSSGVSKNSDELTIKKKKKRTRYSSGA